MGKHVTNLLDKSIKSRTITLVKGEKISPIKESSMPALLTTLLDKTKKHLTKS